MPINSLWFKWKSLKFPWRKMFLVGRDLDGRTFWEFKDALNAGRMRRIVKTDPKTHHADVNLSPQWLQWLRYTRLNAPTIEEQEADLIRQARLKQLARIADAKWNAKESLTQPPTLTAQQREQLSQIKKGGTRAAPQAQAQAQKQQQQQQQQEQEQPPKQEGEPQQPGEDPELVLRGEKVKNPFAEKRRTGPAGSEWQPESWTPPAPRRR